MGARETLSSTVKPDQWLVARRLTVSPLDRPGRLTLEPGVELFGPVGVEGEYLKFSLGNLALSCRVDDFLEAVDAPATDATLKGCSLSCRRSVRSPAPARG